MIEKNSEDDLLELENESLQSEFKIFLDNLNKDKGIIYEEIKMANTIVEELKEY